MKTSRLALAIAVLFSTASFAAADGAAIFKAKCKGCHGAEGKAETENGKKYEVEDMTTAEWQKKSDEDIVKAITDGLKKSDKHKFAEKMKPMKGKLSAEEIDAVAKFVRTLKK